MKRSLEIDEAVAYIHTHLHDQLTLARLAEHVAYSPYHFSRMFKEQVGLSPLYYVSALRLQKAKDLLINTGLSIRDIGLEIGQQSLGTFTTRFSKCVGVTPSEFRHSLPYTAAMMNSLLKLGVWREIEPQPSEYGTVEGTVRTKFPFEGVIFIGLFAKPIPEGIPMRGTLMPGPGAFSITGVKPGTYYLMATAVPWGSQETDILLPYATLRTHIHKPLIVTPYGRVVKQEVILNKPRQDDPPILTSLPLLMNRFLKRMGKHNNR
ncbi:AraC family transcriptional regulator [Bacillus sp. V3-13]|uniref:helix-turn-helix domain-containing protein n=1 Tax=Bacillus sp. V3-13 TaxID=2053728 RepID=UPI000C794AE8|nr:AraC family transcriptional regulator [Bacillus sp. V3-13]PLR78376.1 AraC family transcriptional regulator [Bacillus sp. V3-13]